MMHQRSELAVLSRGGRLIPRGRGVFVWDRVRGMFVRSGSGLTGLGVYPGDPCYDPTRPSWLPYWWDTNSENLCRFGAYPGVTTLAPVPAPPGGQAPGAPQTLEQMTVPGAYTPDMSMTAAHDATAAANLSFFQNLAQSPAFGAPPGPGLLGSIPTWLWIAAIAAVFLMIRR